MAATSDSSRPKNGPLATGPALIAIVLNWWLYGILLMQYYMYLKNARKDNRLLRAIVHLLVVADTIQTFMAMDDAFYWFVYNFGDYTKMFELNLASINAPFMDAIIAITVQLVYCWRVWVLGKWVFVPAAIAFLALASCVNGMFVGIRDLIVSKRDIPVSDPITDYPILIWLWTAVVTDISIALSMTYLLLRFRSQGTSRGTMVLLKRILVLTLETNALTTIVATGLAVNFLIKPLQRPATNIYLPFGYTLGKLYSNCFLVLLNQRLSFEEDHRSHDTMGTTGILVHSETTQCQGPGVSIVSDVEFAEVSTQLSIEQRIDLDCREHGSHRWKPVKQKTSSPEGDISRTLV